MATQMATDAARQKLAGGKGCGMGIKDSHGCKLEHCTNKGKRGAPLASASARAYVMYGGSALRVPVAKFRWP